MSREHVAEVTESVILLVVLLVTEFLFFGLDGLSNDAADLVTVCAFGGLAAAAVRTGLRDNPTGGSELASAILGVVATLAILHGAHGHPAAGLLAQHAFHLNNNKWDAATGLLYGLMVGFAVAVGAEVVWRRSEAWQATVGLGQLAWTVSFSLAPYALGGGIAAAFVGIFGPSPTVVFVLGISFLAAGVVLRLWERRGTDPPPKEVAGNRK